MEMITTALWYIFTAAMALAFLLTYGAKMVSLLKKPKHVSTKGNEVEMVKKLVGLLTDSFPLLGFGQQLMLAVFIAFIVVPMVIGVVLAGLVIEFLTIINKPLTFLFR